MTSRPLDQGFVSIVYEPLEKKSNNNENRAVICGQSTKYRTFHGLGQAKFPNGGSVLGLSQFSIQLHPKIFKIDQNQPNINHLTLLI